MSLERQVYLLDPQCLNPKSIAVAFAKTSRSPQSFREIAAELTDEKTRRIPRKMGGGLRACLGGRTRRAAHRR